MHRRPKCQRHSFAGPNDGTPDGKQLLVVVPAAIAQGDAGKRPTQQINSVLNWLEELKAQVPAK